MKNGEVVHELAATAVIGGGTMGAGIAQVLLGTIGVSLVQLIESDDESLTRAVDRVRHGLERQHRKADDSETLVDTAMRRLLPRVGIGSDASVDLVIEAVPEVTSLKATVLADASQAWPGALIASNTSSPSVTELAKAVAPGSAFIGLHFFNPASRSKLVEIVRPDDCEPATVEKARTWVARLGKESIEVVDSPGFATDVERNVK